MKKYLKQNEQKALNLFVQKIKDELKNNVVSIRLFGSKVRGDFNKDSDIDVLITIKENNFIIIDKITDILVEIELEYDAKISPVVYSEFEYNKNEELGSTFIRNLNEESMLL